MPAISVVIPAYNEEKHIGRLLDALNTQSLTRNKFEIIVVDNNSTDQTPRVARQHGADKVIHEIRKGTNMARQRGVEESRGIYIAFLDADCIPPVDWLEHLLRTFEHAPKKMVALAGPYHFDDDETLRLKLGQGMYWNLIFPLMGFCMGRLLGKGGVMMGGNFAARKNDIEKIEGFDTSYKFFGDDASIAKKFGTLGYVKFDRHFGVVSSARRFHHEGLMATNMRYIKHYFQVMFFS